MNKKIIASVILASSIALCNQGFAAEYSGLIKAGKVVISGVGCTPGATLNVTAFPKGAEPDNTESLVAMTEKCIAEDGTVTVEFGVRMDKEETMNADGIMAYLKESEHGSVQTLEIKYSIKRYNTFLNNLKTADAGTLETIFNNPEYLDIMYEFGIDGYLDIQSEAVRNDTIKYFLKCLDRTNITPEKVKSAYDRSYSLALLNNKTSDAISAINILNPVFEGVHFNELNDEKLKVWLTENAVLKSYDSLSDFEKAYEMDNIFYIINTCKSSKLEAVLSKYAEETGIITDAGYIKYLSLGTVARGRVSDGIVSLLKKNPVRNADDLKSVINEAISSAERGSSGGSGGGGSSSGRGGLFSDDNAKSGFAVSNNDTGTNKSVFSDLENVDWAVQAIETLYKKGIVSGVGENKFDPDAPVTREQFVKMVVLAAGIMKTEAKSEFEDVDANEWYYPYVSSAVEAGFVKGLSPTTFGIGQNIKRQDAAVLLYRIGKSMNRDFGTISEPNFTDNELISDYAKEAVGALSNLNVINGTGNGEYAPHQVCTRAQAAKIIYAFFEV